MKRYIILAILTCSALFAQAIDTKFQEGYVFTPSKYEIKTNSNISLMDNKVVFVQGDSVYSAIMGDSLDLEKATPEKGLEKLGIEGQFAYDKNSKTIIFSSGGKLYSSSLNGKNEWSKATPLEIEGLTPTRKTEHGSSFAYRRWRYKTEGKIGLYNPALSQNGNKLYFSAELENGKGGRDIWVMVRKTDNTWSAPKNLEKANSNKNEDFPFLSNDKVLYISSDRESNLANWNIYRCDLASKTEPSLLPETINSNNADKNLIGNDKCIYLLSDRNGAMAIHHPSVIVTEVPQDTTAQDSVANTETDTISSNLVIKDFNTCIFYFEYDKDITIDSYEKEYATIIEFINAVPNSKFEIIGHTDERGDANYNLTLSNKRAKKVYDTLIQKGVKKSILKHKGVGKSQPEVVGAQTEDEHQKNRRVEIKRIKEEQK